MSGVAARHAAPLALVLLTLASAGVRFWAGRGVDLPWIAPDETIYALLGRSLWEDGWPSLLGTAASSYSFVYPALIGLPLAFGDLATGVTRGAGARCSAHVSDGVRRVPLGTRPARSVVGGRRGRTDSRCAGPRVLGPGDERGCHLPDRDARVVGIAAAIARPSLARQALAGGAIVLALATHVRLVALIPTLFVAVALQCGFVRSLEPARRLVVLLAGTAGASRRHCSSASRSPAAGTTSSAPMPPPPAATSCRRLAKDVVWHAGGVFVVVAGVPLIALAAMSIECVAQRVRDPAAAALVATTAAWTSCLVLEIGTFASKLGRARRTPGPAAGRAAADARVRTLDCTRRTATRSWIQAAALAVAAGALVLPVRRFSTQESALDAVSMIPFWRLAEATSGQTLELVYALSVGALVALAVFLPQRARVALPVIVAVVLVTLSVLSTREIDRLTQLDRAWVFDVGDPRWVDVSATGPVTYLQASAFPAGVWKHLFWNRRIESVAVLKGAAAVGPLTPVNVELRPDGVIRPADGRAFQPALVAAPADFDLAGERIAQAPRSTDLAGLGLWRVDPPLRLLTRGTGVQPNGDVIGTRRRSRVQLRPWTARADAARQAGDADRGPGERDHVGGAEGRLGRGVDRERPCPTRRGRPLALPLRAGEPGAGRLDPARVRA